MAAMQRRDGEVKDSEFRDGMPFFGGSLWLDLLNSTLFDGTAQHDFIATPESFARWLHSARMPAAGGAPDLSALQDFRERLRKVVDQLRAGGAVPQDIVDAVNAHLAGTVIRLRLLADNDGLRLEERLDAGANGAAGIIAEDFARFMGTHEPERLKRCSNPACTMVFYDRGKNNARRWCTMSLCGNRDKVARYRSRHGASGQKTDP
jgi:predicted RNA-binding Zn ribbon-like protein